MERMPKNYHAPEGHLFRYHLASGFVSPGDTVFDAACGVGYGSAVLIKGPALTAGSRYIGVDVFKSPELDEFANESVRFVIADLSDYHPDFEFDVFVGFETVEHLTDYAAYLDMAKKSRKWMLLSVPVIPTKHQNIYHKHDFVRGELPAKIVDRNWRLFQTLDQPSEVSEIYVFKRVIC
jgi:cyclopropane fatty-acyl-phospholipid synthase-like methyltransferase